MPLALAFMGNIIGWGWLNGVLGNACGAIVDQAWLLYLRHRNIER